MLYMMKEVGVRPLRMASSLGGGAATLAVVERVILATAAKIHPLMSSWSLGFLTSPSKGMANNLLPGRFHHLSTVSTSILS